MSIQNAGLLPANILTTNQYENQQMKASTEEDALGRNAFLELFTTQLKNQNPLSPMDNEAFVAQLAQFSSLEAMKGVQASMEEMAAESKTEKFLLGSNLLGKTLNLDGSSVRGGAGREIEATALMPMSADEAVFSVYDAESGQLIYREDLKKLKPAISHSRGMVKMPTAMRCQTALTISRCRPQRATHALQYHSRQSRTSPQ